MICFFLAALGLGCHVQAFSGGCEWRLLFVLVPGLLTAGTSHCRAPARGVQASVVVARRLSSTGSVVLTQELSCPLACGIFPDQG